MDSSGMMKFELKKLNIASHIKCLLWLAVFLLAWNQGIAQLPDYYHLQLFDNSYGIRPGNIERLAKDKQGFLWVLYPRSVQRFDGRETITYKPEGVPPLIIQPYVENAIWHGLLHKESSGHLHVHITRQTSSLLECIIEDNGIGREKAKELKSKSASNSKSLGMKLTESRLALLNKHSNWDASVEIIDLKNESGDSEGTRVVLRIPVDA